MHIKHGPQGLLWLGIPLAVLAGSFFYAPLGLILPLLIILAAVSNLFSKRWFCRKACPRAHWLPALLGGVSLGKKAPAFLRDKTLRRVLCGFMMFCAIAQGFRLWPRFEALGWFFWGICALTVALALILGFIYHPRTWCLLCPMGTLQDSLSFRRKEYPSRG